MAVEKQQAHRASNLKQTNKGHKHGKHRSKGSISIATKGKVSLKTISKKHKSDLNKDQRRHQAQQIRKNKRNDLLNKKRALGVLDSVPFLVCIVPLHKQMDASGAVTLLTQCDSEAVVNKSPSGTIHINLPRFKQRFSLITPDLDNELAIMDTLKVCDTVIFLISANAGIEFASESVDNWGQNVICTALAQGLPTPVVAITDLERLPTKKRNDQKQIIQKLVSKWLPDEKVVPLDKESDAINVLRKIGHQKRRNVIYRDRRPHMIAESHEYVQNEGIDGTLKITGYLRGVPLSVNQLVYLPGLGSFQMSQIDAPYDPFVQEKNKHGNNAMEEDMTANKVRVLDRVDVNKQEGLQSENIPDPLDAEQTWPTEEEIQMAQEDSKTKRVKKVPKGWSEYQAAWIPDEDGEEVDDVSDEDEEKDDDMEAMSDDESEGDEKDEEFETMTESEIGINDQQYDENIDLLTERTDLEKIKEAKMDRMFPDEIDTPHDLPARTRFQKYRGLESFRTSPWDPKENLPSEYSRIFQFENFERTRRRILKEQEDKDGAQPGWFITVHVQSVSQHAWTAFEKTKAPIVLIGQFPHENKMSVLNVVLKRTKQFEEPIKSKERLIFQCGYRRFIVNPVFSQHTNGKKHKYERFFQPDSTVVATFFAPIQFSPAPVLCYKEINGKLILVATGTLLSCNPDRIISKRIVLSGHPLKVNKHSAVVRFMFFNREDIAYFKPCKLRTKHGRIGHIRMPLGTHGHMKCVFDGQLKSQDTILLHLYKRMFPKWTYEECVVSLAADAVMDV